MNQCLLLQAGRSRGSSRSVVCTSAGLLRKPPPTHTHQARLQPCWGPCRTEEKCRIGSLSRDGGEGTLLRSTEELELEVGTCHFFDCFLCSSPGFEALGDKDRETEALVPATVNYR